MSQSMMERAERLDRSRMDRVIAATGGQIRFALDDPGFPARELGARAGPSVAGEPAPPVGEVLVVGMGGSALPVDILNDALSDRIPRAVGACRHYALPARRSARRLLVFSSFSGNTEEVLEPLQALAPGTTDVAIMTAGGALAEIGRDRRIPVIRIPAEREPAGFQPRSASGYIVTYLARLLDAAGYAELPAGRFRALARFLDGADFRAEGEAIARRIEGRIPLFYTDEEHALSVGRIAKIKYNENAKQPAFFNALPEANHNEMIGFGGAREDYAVVYFRDPESHPAVHRRFETMREVLGSSRIRFSQCEMRGASGLERVFSALTVADWISYYAALLAGVDPTPVALVEEFKRRLARPERISAG